MVLQVVLPLVVEALNVKNKDREKQQIKGLKTGPKEVIKTQPNLRKEKRLTLQE